MGRVLLAIAGEVRLVPSICTTIVNHTPANDDEDGQDDDLALHPVRTPRENSAPCAQLVVDVCSKEPAKTEAMPFPRP